MHASAVRALFRTLSLQDDASVFAPEAPRSRAAYTVFCNPARYASAVKTLVIADPALPEDGTALHNTLRPIDANHIARLLEICTNVEEFAWESSFPPPNGLCEVCGSFVFLFDRLTQLFRYWSHATRTYYA